MVNLLIDKRIEIYNEILKDKDMLDKIEKAGKLIGSTAKDGSIILICGNGGSAAEALHLSSEIIGKFQIKRDGLPAIALPADCSALSAIGNDFGFEEIFARQVQAFKDSAKLLIVISTSGNSINIIKAAQCAKFFGMNVVGLLGKDGGKVKTDCDIPILIPSNNTAIIQEVHLMIIHFLCFIMEEQI
jgi:D-sedoheptulose 7-phosphate isomerase